MNINSISSVNNYIPDKKVLPKEQIKIEPKIEYHVQEIIDISYNKNGLVVPTKITNSYGRI